MSLISGLKREIQAYLSLEQINQVTKAYTFAKKAHTGQKRQNGDPYITHPLSVAKILAHMHMDAATIVAAILHDVIEDTSVDKRKICELFSLEIANLVDGVSKLTKLQAMSKAEAQAENFRKMLLAMTRDIRVIIIKLADRLHNMSTLRSLSQQKRVRIAQETLDIYAPIAQRLGMHTMSIKLEDLCFSYLYPYRYSVLKEAVEKTKLKQKILIEKIKRKLQEALTQRFVMSHAIWHKKKHLYRIYKKMREKNRTFYEVIDTLVFCIIVDNVDNCYRVLGAVHHCFKPIPEQFRDYIAIPKTNGYQALHTAVLGPSGSILKIQIRTVSMDHCADYGITQSWLRTPIQQRSPVKTAQWLQQLSDIQKITPSSLEFMEMIKADLFPAEIYVFTPAGDIVELPINATPVDLAYAIHSNVGNHCVAARVDQRLVPLSMHLNTGQRVEIITDVNTIPNVRWLDFVVTGKARSHIRQFLKTQKHSESILFGQRLLDYTLLELGVYWSHIKQEKILHLLQTLKYKDEEDLLEAIGLGYLSAHTVLELIDLPYRIPSQALLINGDKNTLIKFAECCRPIPGDKIVGLFAAGQGLIVHIKRCIFVNRYIKKNPNCIVRLDWEANTQGNFKISLRIETLNQPGTLAQLTYKINQQDASIDTLRVEHRDKEHTIIHLILSVSHRKHLANILRSLRTMKTIFKIVRSK
jgi:GTP diphosphokinase / guanosine-3',5'-bis(diphosphate) 3'-diphosphatase